MQEERHWPAIHAFFNSDLNAHNAQEAGVPLAHAEVIHSGIDTDFFSFKRSKAFGNPLTLFQPGRIEQNKGQLDAVELCAALHARGIPCKLTIVGDRWKEIYAQEMENRIRELGLNSSVRILPMQSRSTLVKLYHQADICLFLSRYRSGFSRIPLEAMACGSLLLSYGNEGSDEILRDGENGYIIPKGDIPAIAERIKTLIAEPEAIASIIHQARADIENDYSMVSYTSKIEAFLKQAI
jgi:glycosyltransferase involved in cell wall biosynthesis